MGAKFCTICGHRLAADDASDAEPLESSSTETSATKEAPPGGSDNGDHASWPTQPTGSSSTGDANTTWLPSPASSTPGGTTDDAGQSGNGQDQEPPSIWAANPANGWPTPITPDTADQDDAATPEGLQGGTTGHLDDDPGETDLTMDERAEEHDLAVAHARDQALALLDELRRAISAISGDEPPMDLSGVIEELEVAGTPPGAIGSDDLADLRDALLAARERPRDIDTMVALTSRLDAMVSLIFAYDRAIAAIERSLETLRRG